MVSKIPMAIPTTHVAHLQTLVENRKIFNAKHIELNIFETHKQAQSVSLTFSDLTLTSMLRGKKIMSLTQKQAFEYLPGESVVVPAHETMLIDFPDANTQNPTQCIALVIDNEKIKTILESLNEKFPKIEKNETWQIETTNQYVHLQNNIDIKDNIDRIVHISQSENPLKDILAEVSVQELLIRIMQTQAQNIVFGNYQKMITQNRFAFVLDYIHHHITETITIDQLSKQACLSSSHFFKLFKQEFNISPLDYILHQRIKLAQHLLKTTTKNITEVCYAIGFNSPTYFNKIFKKIAGCTPQKFKIT